MFAHIICINKCICSVGSLRTKINKLKQGRSITPKLTFIRGGQDDATIFEKYLLEEQDVDEFGYPSKTGFVSFLEEITTTVKEYLVPDVW